MKERLQVTMSARACWECGDLDVAVWNKCDACGYEFCGRCFCLYRCRDCVNEGREAREPLRERLRRAFLRLAYGHKHGGPK
jgi:hypothetical protein